MGWGEKWAEINQTIKNIILASCRKSVILPPKNDYIGRPEKCYFAPKIGQQYYFVSKKIGRKKETMKNIILAGAKKKCYFADGACGIIGLAPNIPLPIIYLPLLPHTHTYIIHFLLYKSLVYVQPQTSYA